LPRVSSPAPAETSATETPAAPAEAAIANKCCYVETSAKEPQTATDENRTWNPVLSGVGFGVFQ